MDFYKNVAVLLVFTIVAVTTGEALKCYRCSTTGTLGCLDPVANGIDLVDCSKNVSPRSQGKDLLNDILPADAASDNATKVCGKIHYSQGKYVDVLMRDCVPEKFDNMNTCDFAKRQGESKNISIEFCNTCNSDACNSSSMTSTQMLLYIVPFMASLVFFK